MSYIIKNLYYKLYMSEYYQKNREQKIEYQLNYYYNNQKKIRKKQNEYFKNTYYPYMKRLIYTEPKKIKAPIGLIIERNVTVTF